MVFGGIGFGCRASQGSAATDRADEILNPLGVTLGTMAESGLACFWVAALGSGAVHIGGFAVSFHPREMPLANGAAEGDVDGGLGSIVLGILAVEGLAGCGRRDGLLFVKTLDLTGIDNRRGGAWRRAWRWCR